MAYKVFVFIVLAATICAVECRPQGDPNSEVENLNKITGKDWKEEVKNTVNTIDEAVKKMKQVLEESKKTKAGGPGSEARIQTLLEMAEEINRMKATLLSINQM